MKVTIVNTMQLHSPDRALSIGKPISNTNVYILDPDTAQPVPIGAPGVMWAGGACVTRGYVSLPAKTAERYVPDPFMEKQRSVDYARRELYIDTKSSMMFDTGDLG